MKNVLIILVVLLLAAGGYYFYSQSQSGLEQEIYFIEDRDDFIQETAQEYKQENPESELDVEAILKQTSDLALITSALRAYSIDNNGTYPATLDGLVPKYTPAMMFPNGQIPMDYNSIPFDYSTSPDRTSYTLCSQDLEEGGTDCLESNS